MARAKEMDEDGFSLGISPGKWGSRHKPPKPNKQSIRSKYLECLREQARAKNKEVRENAKAILKKHHDLRAKGKVKRNLKVGQRLKARSVVLQKVLDGMPVTLHELELLFYRTRWRDPESPDTPLKRLVNRLYQEALDGSSQENS